MKRICLSVAFVLLAATANAGEFTRLFQSSGSASSAASASAGTHAQPIIVQENSAELSAAEADLHAARNQLAAASARVQSLRSAQVFRLQTVEPAASTRVEVRTESPLALLETNRCPSCAQTQRLRLFPRLFPRSVSRSRAVSIVRE